MAVSLLRALVLFAAVLIGAAAGAYLSFAAAYLVVEPAERTLSGVAFVAVLVLLVVGPALLARKVYGTAGLAAFAIVVLFSAFLTGLAVL